MSSCEIVTSATQTCVVCPEVPAVTAVPEIVTTDPRFGWNASAHSEQSYDGDCYTEFNAPAVVGVVCGFATARLSNDPVFVPHGFYLYQRSGRHWYVVLERGVAVTAPVERALAFDVYRIERRGDAVSYLVSGVEVHASSAPSHGSLLVVACLYSADDGVN